MITDEKLNELREGLIHSSRSLERLIAIKEVVDEQKKNKDLWWTDGDACPAHLQDELRRLHRVIEGKDDK